MVLGLFAKFFPPPKYLARPALGLDISDRSLKYIKLQPGRQHFQVELFGEKPIPPGIVDAGQIKNPTALGKLLGDLRQEVGVSYSIVSLPEEHAFILSLNLPYMAPSQLRASIELQLNQHVPLAPDQAVFDYETVHPAEQPGENFNLAVTVFPRQIMLDYQQVLNTAGFTPLAYEIEAQAIARAVLQRHNRDTTMIIDFGKTRTSFFIARQDKVLFTSTLADVGGESLTQAVKKNLNLPYAAAEELKEKHGLLDSQNRELIYALIPTLSVLRDEINKIYNYWAAHQGPVSPLNQIVVCGGQATLPGLVDYLAAAFPVPVNIGNVWTNVLPIKEVTPPITFNQSQKYATALGLALRQFYD